MNLKFRHIVVLMMTTVLIVSCGQDAQQGGTEEPVPVPETGTPIVFMASQQPETAVTRATTPLADDQTTFKVWGFKNYSYNENENGKGSFGDVQTVFQGYTVQYAANSQSTTTTNAVGWEYILSNYPDQSIKYWDWASTAYRFFGVTGEEITPTVRTTAYEFGLPADTLHVGDAPYFSHLWFSDGNPSHYPEKPFGQTVQLTFLKPFAKVRFLFIPGDPKVELSELNIEDPVFSPVSNGLGITIKGTFYVSYPLEGTATTETWHVERNGASGSSMNALTTPERWYTVLPANNQGAYKLTVTVNGDPDKGCIVPAEYMIWLPSYEYTYIFKVNDEGGVNLGQVQTAYTDWLIGAEAGKTLFNW